MVILDAPNGNGEGGEFPSPSKVALGPAPPQPPRVVNCKLERMDVSGPMLFGNLDAVTLSARYPKKLSLVMPMQEYMVLRRTFNTKVRELFAQFVDRSSETASVTAFEVPIYAVMGIHRERLMRKADKEFLKFIDCLNNDLRGRNIRIIVRAEASEYVAGPSAGPGPVMRRIFLEAPVPVDATPLYK